MTLKELLEHNEKAQAYQDSLTLNEQIELAAGTLMLSSGMGSVGAVKTFNNQKTLIYNQLAGNLDSTMLYLDTLKKNTSDPSTIEQITKAQQFAFNVAKAVRLSPSDVTGAEVDLLMEKTELLKEKDNTDSAFHKPINNKIAELDKQIVERSSKDNPFEEFSSKMLVKDVRFIPISALLGDNVVNRSKNMDWYQGPTLMYLLETIHIAGDENHVDCRLPIQYVIRPQKDEFHDYRGYAGRISGGIFKPGDKVLVLPSGFSSKIKSVDTFDGPVEEAFAPMSVTVTLEDDIDISRGDMIVRENNVPEVGQDIDVMVCWLNSKPLQLNGKYAIKHTTKDVRCIVKEVKYRININTLHRDEENKEIKMNDIGRVTLRTTSPLFYDEYTKNRITGSLVLIDEATNVTVGAAMIH